jgi:Tfp pilus assembly protein PilO
MKEKAKSNNIIGLAMLAIVLCLVLAWLNLVPMVTASRLEAKEAKDGLKQAQEKLDSFNSAGDKIAEIKDTIDKVAIAVPDNSNYQSILVSLDAIGTKENLPISNFQPALKQVEDTSEVFPKMNFSFSTTGDYAHVTNLVKDIETNLRIIKIDTMNLSQVGSDQVQLSLTVSSFSRNNPSGGN